MKIYKFYIVKVIFFINAFSWGIYSRDTTSFEIIHGPYLQNITETSATVVFMTNKPAVPGVIVQSGKNEPRFVQNSHDGLVDAGKNLHKVRISKISPGQQYSYRIFACEIIQYDPYKIVYGDTIISANFSFTTFDKNKKEIKYTVFSDIHSNASKLSNYLDKNSIMEQDCYFFNGDILNYFEKEDQLFSDFLDTAIARFASCKPFFYVRGNHEARGKYARSLKEYFDFPSNRYYYAFTHGPVHFIVLDSGEDKPDSNQYYHGLADFDSYLLEELDWLKSHLKTSGFKNAAFKVVLVHIPVIKQENAKHRTKFLARYFGPVLNNAGIDLMISGHLHENIWLKSGESGFKYPVLICSNNHFVEVKTNKSGISMQIKNIDGDITYNIKTKKGGRN